MAECPLRVFPSDGCKKMAAERSVLLRRGPDPVGLGFSLLGTKDLPPVIYDILENSPAAASGEVSSLS